MLCSFFVLLFRLNHFYQSVFKFIDFLLSSPFYLLNLSSELFQLFFRSKLSIWFSFFAETFCSFQECSPFLEHFYNNALKSLSDNSNIWCHLSVDVCLLSHASWDFPMQFWIAFYGIIRPWVLFKFYGDCSFLCFACSHPLWFQHAACSQLSVGCDFSVSLVFKACSTLLFGSVLWVYCPLVSWR